MSIALIIWGALCVANAMSLLPNVASAVHQILIAIYLLIGTVSIGLGCVIRAVQGTTAPAYEQTPVGSAEVDVAPLPST